MNKQSQHNKVKLDSGVVPIVLTLNDAPLKVKKNSASEPIYIDHV